MLNPLPPPLPSLVFAVLWALPAAPQDTPPRFTPPPAGANAQPGAASALQPGVLPQGATEAARALWKGACAAALAPGAAKRRVSAFNLTFQILTRRGVQSNQTEARFLYLDSEGYVRTSLQSGREHVLGPDGAWLIDGKEKIRLTITRENEEDLRQIDETVSIARNFLALTDPSSLRIAALAELAAAPSGIPEALLERASALRWLDVQSPDFLLLRPTGMVPTGRSRDDDLFRVRLGLDPATGRVEQALVGDDRGPQAETAVLVELKDASPLDGYLVPGRMFVYELDPHARPRRFAGRPALELWRVPPGTLQPSLGPDDFRP